MFYRSGCRLSSLGLIMPPAYILTLLLLCSFLSLPGLLILPLFFPCVWQGMNLRLSRLGSWCVFLIIHVVGAFLHCGSQFTLKQTAFCCCFGSLATLTHFEMGHLLNLLLAQSKDSNTSSASWLWFLCFTLFMTDTLITIVDD